MIIIKNCTIFRVIRVKGVGLAPYVNKHGGGANDLYRK